jgi:hypothetical protein
MDERIHAERIPYLSMHSAFHIPIPSQHTDIYEPTLCYGPPSFSKTIIGNHVFFPPSLLEVLNRFGFLFYSDSFIQTRGAAWGLASPSPKKRGPKTTLLLFRFLVVGD